MFHSVHVRFDKPLCRNIVLAATVVLALGPSVAMAQSGQDIVLAPHRAVYEIELAETRGGSSISNMTGRMVYELTGSSCAGYTQSMRFVTRVSSQEGSPTISDLRSSSWEDVLAKSFRFSSTQYKDSKLEDTTDGDAKREDPKGDIKVEITKPAKKEISLKRNTYFPVQHSMALLEAARQGERTFAADLYDGSEKGEKVYSTMSFIGIPNAPGYNKTLKPVENTGQLDKLKSWPVSISYFELGADHKDSLPSYELAFLYFENGISRQLFIDYGDFSVRGNLKSLTMLEPQRCQPVR
ncbi:MAG: cell envelope integrity EipB family protein [Hyphomicrobiaceae bacterium]